MLPLHLRSNNVGDAAKTAAVIKSITAVKDETRSNLIAKKMKAVALYVFSEFYTA
jgi:hypothetical protein